MAYLSTEENDIMEYMKTSPHEFISAREIARKAGGRKRFEKDRYWATAPLMRLVEKNILESDALGHYRIKESKEARSVAKPKPKVFVSPAIAQILKESGKEFDGVYDLDEPESKNENEKEEDQ